MWTRNSATSRLLVSLLNAGYLKASETHTLAHGGLSNHWFWDRNTVIQKVKDARSQSLVCKRLTHNEFLSLMELLGATLPEKKAPARSSPAPIKSSPGPRKVPGKGWVGKNGKTARKRERAA